MTEQVINFLNKCPAITNFHIPLSGIERETPSLFVRKEEERTIRRYKNKGGVRKTIFSLRLLCFPATEKEWTGAQALAGELFLHISHSRNFALLYASGKSFGLDPN